MKKKILLLVVIVLSLFFVSGCGKKEQTDTDSEVNEKEIIKTQVKNLTISLDQKGSFNSLSFKYPKDALTGNTGTFYNMDYMNGEEFVFRITMYLFENKEIDQVMVGDSITFLETKSINGKEYKVYKGVTQDGKNLINYAVKYNNDTYTITFIFDDDISNLIDEFMNAVKFK